ncbi:uroporphyrinogen-III synthase [Castellaniella caeni]|uniref:uroporphyrinogen-III synthase n=1 Tax=Castellaniella caeni TaxID=266123 RepID=UPI000C9F57CA|nr:uroporphyrinogen-III synthase [Castellaniella caeni]
MEPRARACVLLTRPLGRNETLGHRLRAAGLTVVEAPALRIRELDTPRPVPVAGELFMFVSGQAVAAYFSRMRQPWPTGAWAGAVGVATARALAAHVPGDRILAPSAGQAADSESLLAVIEQRLPAPGAAHILRAGHGRDWLAGQLRARGWHVDFHALYERGPQPWDAAQCHRLACGARTILLVTSEEALDAIDASLRAQGLAWPARLWAVTLHERIGRRLQCLYAQRPDAALHLVLSGPDESALFQAIVAASRQLP